MVVVQPCVLLLGMISALRMGLEVIEGLVTETAVCLKHIFVRKLTYSHLDLCFSLLFVFFPHFGSM